MNNKLLTVLLVTGGLLLLALLTLNGEVAWLAVPFLAYLGVGILRAPAAEAIRLRAARTTEEVEQDGQRLIQVTVTARSEGTALDQLCMVEQPQPGMRWVDGRLRQWLSLAPGEEAALTYRFQANRGQFSWKTAVLVAFDPLGLIETRLEIPAGASVMVYPALTPFRSLPIRPQRTLHLSGSIPARIGGSGTDFWGIREYQPGDPQRRIDWQHAARHPGHLFTREFEQEEIAEVGLILDARQSTDLRMGDDNLFEHSVRAVASLAEVLLRQGNLVSLLVYGKPLISVYPGYGKGQLNQILSTLSRVSTEAVGSLGSMQYLPVRMFSSRSIIILISPLQAGDWRLFTRLRAYGYQSLLVSPDPVDFIKDSLAEDTSSRLAMRLAQVERKLEIQKIARMWVPVVNWQVRQPLQPLVRSALMYSHRRTGK